MCKQETVSGEMCVCFIYQDGGFNIGSAKMPPLSSAPTVGRRGLASYQPQMLIANRGSGGRATGLP
jgi:hypothetical protein